jgi:hypothetical protein
MVDLVAFAWTVRPSRQPILTAADRARAGLLLSIPLAAAASTG